MSYSTKCKTTKLKLEINWWNGGTKKKGCWRKKIKGKQHYFFYPDTKSGYEMAVLAYAQLRATLDRERPNAEVFHHHQGIFQDVKAYWEQFGLGEAEELVAQQVDDFLNWIGKWLTQPNLPDRIPAGAFSSANRREEFCHEFIGNYTLFGTRKYELPPKWLDRLERLTIKPVLHKRPQTVGFWMDRYLKGIQEKASVSQRSPKTYTSARQHLGIFRSWIGEQRHVVSITSSTWDEYYRHLLLRTTQPSTKTGYRNAARTWMKWAWRQDECELELLPRNIDDPSQSFVNIGNDNDDDSTCVDSLIWTPEEFKAALELLDDYWRCWLLLFLNCGFTQTDVNDLRHKEIDLQHGRIVHKRTKTKRCPRPPVVNYLLWEETKIAIEKVISDDARFAFRTQRGARLTPGNTVTKNGKMHTSVYDNVSRDWQQKRKRTEGLPNKQIRGLRKTGSTTLKTDIKYGWLRTMYLGHVGEIADRHYDAALIGDRPLADAAAGIGLGERNGPPRCCELVTTSPHRESQGWRNVSGHRIGHNRDTRRIRRPGPRSGNDSLAAIRDAAGRLGLACLWPEPCRPPSTLCRPCSIHASPFDWRSSSQGCCSLTTGGRPAPGSPPRAFRMTGTASTTV